MDSENININMLKISKITKYIQYHSVVSGSILILLIRTDVQVSHLLSCERQES